MDVNQSNNTFTLTEKTPPAITATTISTDNQTIKLTMSEAVFANSNGSGDIQKEDFTLSISGGTAKLSNSNPISITKDGNVYTLIVDYTGIANGTETLVISPSVNQICLLYTSPSP